MIDQRKYLLNYVIKVTIISNFREVQRLEIFCVNKRAPDVGYRKVILTRILGVVDKGVKQTGEDRPEPTIDQPTVNCLVGVDALDARLDVI